MKRPHLSSVRRTHLPVAAAVLLGALVVPQSSATTDAGLLGAGGAIFSSVPDRPIVVPEVVEVLDAQPAVAAAAAETDTVTDKGTQLFRISREGGYDLPQAARRAYERAAAGIERTRPGCDLPWGLLAGIGRVESDHGRYGGSQLGTDGVSRPVIIGIALDGVGPVAAIPDTDGGKLDGDRVWDRAVGPMQFIPSTWATAKADGDGDGIADPHDLDDAALAAAGYLCPGSGPIGGEAGIRTALFSYNHSDYYVDLVYAFALGYHTGVFDIPAPPVEETIDEVVEVADDTTEARGGDEGGTAAGPVRPPRAAEPPQSSQPTKNPASSTSPTPTGPVKPPRTPTPSPQPTPTPEPEPPALVLSSASGTWSSCGGGWCLSGSALDLGAPSQADRPAAADFDQDGVVETNRAEFDGLVGSTVSLQTERGTAVVYTINGAGFRNADGSFAS